MEKVKFLLFATSFVCLSGISYAQTGTNKMVATQEPTPANTIKWTKEVLPKMELLSIKLEQVKPTNPKDIESQKIFLKALQTLRNINAKGTKLTAAEARRHDTWFRNTISKALQDCLEQNPGSECCFSRQSQGQGWGSLWYSANCFVARFPDIN